MPEQQAVAIDPASDQTSNTSVQAHILASSTYQVARLNKDLIYKYQGAYSDYVTNMRSGANIPDDQRQPPKPPMAWELAPPDVDGYVWYQIGNTPVCPPGPLVPPNSDNAQVIPKPNHMSINWLSRPKGPSKGSFVTANKDDGMDGGFVTPPIIDEAHPDFPPHTYMRLTTAVGNGWYQELD